MLQVVIDANVLVSSILSPRGVPAQIVEAWHARKFSLVINEAVISEIQNTLEDLDGTGKYFIPKSKIDKFLNSLRENACWVSALPNVAGAIPADPDDEKFLAIAIASKAPIIVSGDKHLLNLKEYQGITILTPRQFLDSLDAE
jgi:putative PIN family toxin of toxin-antitoxin system